MPTLGSTEDIATSSDLAAKAPLASPAFTGNPTAPTPAAGDNDTSIATTAFVTTAVAAGGGGVLAVNSYSPGTQVNYSTTSTAETAVDATNMKVTFTAPDSGKVLIRLTAVGGYTSSGGGFNTFWSLIESTTTVAKRALVFSTSSADTSFSVAFLVTGLTPGSSHIYKWGYSTNSASMTNKIYVGGASGPAVMEVLAAP